MEVLKTITARADELKVRQATEILQRQAAIKKTDDAIRKAEAELSAALAAGDEAAYKAARSQLRELQDGRELHTRFLENIQRKPLIDKSEYEAGKDAILAEMTETCNDDQIKVYKLMNEILSICDQNSARISDVNTFLHSWQRGFYKQPERMQVEENGWLPCPDVKFEDFSLPGLARTIRNSNIYKSCADSAEGSN